MAEFFNLKDARLKVSSVLDRNVKAYGKNFLIDGREDTCWNSDQGTPQYIVVDFGKEVLINQIQLMFQGGFVGKTCWIETIEEQGVPFKKHQDIYPEDSNKLQSFEISPVKCSAAKIVFQDSTDFYGRITIYQLNIN